MKKISLLLLAVFYAAMTFATWEYKSIPSDFLAGYAPTQEERDSILDLETDWYDLTDTLPAGYVTDGSVNYGNRIRAALAIYPNCIWPDFPILLNIEGALDGNAAFILQSNSKLYFQENSQLILYRTGYAIEYYQIIRIREAENVAVYFANIVGDRDEKLANETVANRSGSGMGIEIKGSKNIILYKPHIEKCYGDGIYVASLNNTRYNPHNEDIYIYKAILDNNRRDALTLENGIGIYIDGIICANTNKALYTMSNQMGLVIEPNYHWGRMQNVYVHDMLTYNNTKAGVVITLDKLRSSYLNTVSINIYKTVDIGSGRAMAATLSHHSSGGRPVEGSVNVYYPLWKDQTDPSGSGFPEFFARDTLGDCLIDFNVYFMPTIELDTPSSTFYGGCNMPSSLERKVRDVSAVFPSNVNLICNFICNTDSEEPVAERQRKAETDNLKKMSNTAASTFEVFPNPSSGMLNLAFGKNVMNGNISISNMEGKVLINKKVQGISDKVNIENLPDGVYVVTLQEEGATENSTVKFVKVK